MPGALRQALQPLAARCPRLVPGLHQQICRERDVRMSWLEWLGKTQRARLQTQRRKRLLVQASIKPRCEPDLPEDGIKRTLGSACRPQNVEADHVAGTLPKRNGACQVSPIAHRANRIPCSTCDHCDPLPHTVRGRNTGKWVTISSNTRTHTHRVVRTRWH
jgi:hypothetical protein